MAIMPVLGHGLMELTEQTGMTQPTFPPHRLITLLLRPLPTPLSTILTSSALKAAKVELAAAGVTPVKEVTMPEMPRKVIQTQTVPMVLELQ
jgi:hypothetical protein